MMIRKFIRFNLVLALIVLVMIVLPSFAQLNGITAEEISEKFTKSVTRVLHEKVYLHTDKSVYLVGETLWFKAYNLDAATHRLSGMSKVLYIDLLNDEGKVVKQEAIRLTDGMGDGQLYVAGDLPTGIYRLRAYTSWMKNFDHDFIFDKNLTIVNPSTPIVYKQATESKDSIFLNFFPEGGNMVNGISGRLCINASDAAGHGQKVSGRILDDLDTEISTFTTSSRGFTSVRITPEKNRRYFCQVKSETGDTLSFSIPPAKAGGAVMTLTTNPDGDFDIAVKLAGMEKDTFYIVAHTRGIINGIYPLFISGNAGLHLSKDNFEEGISHLTLMDRSGYPLCERLAFKFPELHAEIETNRKTFGNREKVKVSIALANHKSPLAANISVAVYKVDDLIFRSNSIVSTILLDSDLKGAIRNPRYYFQNVTEEKRQELDNLLIAHRWARFSWQQVIDGQSMPVNYPPEIRAPLLGGKVINSGDGNDELMVSFPGSSAWVNAVELNDEGIFLFEVPFCIKKSKAIFGSPEGLLPASNITLVSPFLPGSGILTEKINLSKDLRDVLEKRFVDIQIAHAFSEKSRIRGVLPAQSDTLLPFYGGASLSYNLDDYTRFVEMKELFIEYIKSVSIHKKQGQQKFYNLFQDQPNLILLNGIPLPNADTALAMDPLKIKTIDIISEQFEMGRVNFPGVINFITYDGDYDDLLSGQSLVEKSYHGIQTPRQFFNPDYSADSLLSTPVPDFRHTLLWSPYVNVDTTGMANVEFFTSDGEGTYLVEINGVSENGSPFSATTQFMVIGEAKEFQK